MILLSGRSLTPARKVPVESMSLQLKERDSSATITPADMTGIQVNSWLKDETDPGAGIVWRVKSIQQSYATQTPTVQLEHAVSTLKDTILFGEHKAAQITGNSKATTCTARQAVMYILRKQSDWALGEFDYANVSNPYKFDGDTLFDCLETISGSLQDAWWSYDFSTYPFKLNITQKPSGVGSEMRASRNLKTLTRTIDKSGMFTRFYPIGANDLHIDGDYVQKNTDLYGVVSKVETDQSIDSKAELTRWANERLADHAEPTVTTEVEGVELAADTGVSLDSMKLGRLCRIPLPEYGTTITERIVALTYSDKVHQPQVFKATLSNTKTDITKIVADALKKGGRGGRAAARREKQDLAWFEDTNDHVSMCAIGIIGVDAKGEPDWIRMTELVADGTGLHSTVQSVQKEQVIQQTRLDQDERSIGMVVEVRNGKEMIKAGEICLAVNESKESTATINAKKIYLLGQTIANTITANYISAKIAGLSRVTMNSAYATGLQVGGGDITMPNGLKLSTNGVWQLSLSQSGNEYTLTEQKLNGTTRTVGTFSRATTLSGAWSGGIFKVTASPQGDTLSSGMLQNGDVSRSGNYIDVKVNSGDTYTGKTLTVKWTDYLSSMTLSQKTNASGSKHFTAYYLAPDGSTYVSMGQAYWYSSGTNLNTSSKTVHY